MLNVWDKKTVEFLNDFCFKDRFTRGEKEVIEAVKLIDKDKLQILDYGCGTGRLVEILKKELPDFDLKNNYIGIDGSEHMIIKARERFSELSSNFYVLNGIDELHIKENFKPTVLISFDVFQHQNDLPSFFDKIFSFDAENIFVTGWSKEKGQNEDHTNHIITLQSGNQFYENVYSEKACINIGMNNSLNVLIIKEKKEPNTVLFYLESENKILSFLTGLTEEEINNAQPDEKTLELIKEKKLDEKPVNEIVVPQDLDGKKPLEIVDILSKVDLTGKS